MAFQAVVAKMATRGSITHPHRHTYFPPPHPVTSVWFYVGIEVISDFMCVSVIQELDTLMDEQFSILFQVLVPI